MTEAEMIKRGERFSKWWSEEGFMIGTSAATYKVWQAALAAAPTPPTPEANPIGFIHRPPGLGYEWQFSDLLPVDDYVKEHRRYLLVYAHPAGNKLRMAAEEALAVLVSLKKKKLLGKNNINVLKALRAELDKQQ